MDFFIWLTFVVLTFKSGVSQPTKGTVADSNVFYMDPGDIIVYTPETRHRGFFSSDIRIYCYKGSDKALAKIFQSVQLQLDIDTDSFSQYEGSTPEIVKAHYEEQKSIFSINLFSQKKTRLKLHPFNQTCIGIDTVEPYRVRLNLIRIDFWKFFLLLFGIFIFTFAKKLSQNSIFYYISGVLLGICASFMILIYLAGKLFPKRPMMYGVLVGGWTVGIYIIQLLWENLQTILVIYQTYVFWYILVTGFISFVICYRLGPPVNQRSKNLIKWGLQIVALIMIFCSSQFEETSTAISILTVLVNYFPRSWIKKVRMLYARKFPPKPKLLTVEEFNEQGVVETAKALDELRNYCSSPECKQWRMITKLKDPIRFASFIEGSSHLSDSEVLNYETTRYEDDEEFSDDVEISEDEDDLVTSTNRSNVKVNGNSYKYCLPSTSHSNRS